MAHVDWEIKAREFGNCNCDYGCPCQFNALPTHGNCEAVVGFDIEEGHFGDLKSKDISPAKMSESASAFANTDGGELWIGIV